MAGTACLKKKTTIIQKIESMYWQIMHSYGIKLPKIMQKAIKITSENNSTLLYDAIAKETGNCRIDFENFSNPLSQMLSGYF